ncbi:cation transporter [Maricaulis sp. W15]|uniref:Cation efflux family protein n=1 Tax=Maricaulis maris TaxID=74318 RepID=A0A495D2W5_9PROT|nr:MULTISPECIES: cation transporter [Maricaulis]OLF71366.1 cation transporter [Maricaulis sp. W15]RKQ96074.1 cation efflux family protein [Maricaulis maris]
MSAGCGHAEAFDGSSPGFRRALWAVIAINAIMFVVEMLAGAAAQSQALKADALDFAADAATYGLSLYVIGKPAAWRANAALIKAASLLLIGVSILGLAIWRTVFTVQPEAGLMGSIAVLALIANLASVLILMRWRDGDANVRSVWLCSRNDAIGNLAVLASAGLVAWTATPWPDLAVAAIMAGLFTSSAIQIMRQAIAERAGRDAHQHGEAGCGNQCPSVEKTDPIVSSE